MSAIIPNRAALLTIGVILMLAGIARPAAYSATTDASVTGGGIGSYHRAGGPCQPVGTVFATISFSGSGSTSATGTWAITAGPVGNLPGASGTITSVTVIASISPVTPDSFTLTGTETSGCAVGATVTISGTCGVGSIVSRNIFFGSAFESGSFGGTVTCIGAPLCLEDDGNGNFNGNNGNGNFNDDDDQCEDGISNSVSSTDVGDGSGFISTNIISTKFDMLAHTVTITGLGTHRGVPVAFTFIALESGPTTPGWVSFAFSDGYSNAGTLISGGILLH